MRVRSAGFGHVLEDELGLEDPTEIAVRAIKAVKGETKGGHWGGVKVDLLRERLRLGKAAVSRAGTQSGDACEGGP